MYSEEGNIVDEIPIQATERFDRSSSVKSV